MIIKFNKPGQSFKGLADYLTHDAEDRETDARVAFTQTFNLAHDHVPSAIHEMYTTWMNAETLKTDAGIRAGGRKTEKPVKHVSLSWHPSEKPDKGEMISAALSFLEHMGWAAHQTVLVAHDDKPHAHVHLVVNAIHPETGLKLDVSHEKRRAQEWGREYEKSRGPELCPQRSLPREQREVSEPRPVWMAMKENVQREVVAEADRLPHGYTDAEPDPGRTARHREWTALKATQREEREAFFAGGRQVYGELNRAIYREVHAGFRKEWAALYAAGRRGLDYDVVRERKEELIARERAVIELRREAAAAALREERDFIYRALLDGQKAERKELTERQEQGQASPETLARADAISSRDPAKLLHDALDRFGIKRGRGNLDPARSMATARGDDLFGRRGTGRAGVDAAQPPPSRSRSFGMGSAVGESRNAPSRDLASGLAGGLLGLIGALGESMTGGPGKAAPRSPAPEVDPLDRFGIRRGRPSPDAEQENRTREKAEREAWYAWKKKRDLILDR